MAYQSNKSANTGAPGPTPAPRKTVTIKDLDRGWPKRASDIDYGQNQYPGRVVTDPGEQVSAGLKVNADDPTMRDVLARGTGRSNTAAETLAPQTRDVGSHPSPDAFGSASARARQASSHSHVADKVPGAIERNAQETPIRKPVPSQGKF